VDIATRRKPSGHVAHYGKRSVPKLARGAALQRCVYLIQQVGNAGDTLNAIGSTGKTRQEAKEEETMCLSCGCKQPNEAHGDERNITMDSLQQAADAGGVSLEDAARNIQEGVIQRSPVGVGAGRGTSNGQTESSNSGDSEAGYTGQQPGSTGGGTEENEKPFNEKERREREF
jgi:hypothetical protein